MSTSPTSPPRWSPETKRWAILGVFIILGALLYYGRSALGWLVVASLLAYLLQPIVNRLDEHGLPRALAALIALLIAIAILVVIPLILLPMLITQFMQLFESLLKASIGWLDMYNNWLTTSGVISILGIKIDISGLIMEFAGKFIPANGENGVFVPDIQDISAYLQQAITAAGGILGSVGGFLTSVVKQMVSLTISFFLMLFYTFYITMDGHKLKPWVESMVKPAYLPEIKELGHRINRVWQAFFRGQLTLSLVIGGVTLVVGLAIGLPSALALAIIAGVMEAVPTLGPILAAIPAIIMALTQGSSVLPVDNVTFAIITLVAYILIQQAENVLIVPRIMGSALELHPMVVLVGIVIGASFAGILGIFLAAPTLATLKLLLTYTHAKLLDIDPYPISFEEEQAALARQRGPKLRIKAKTWSHKLSSMISRKSDENSD